MRPLTYHNLFSLRVAWSEKLFFVKGVLFRRLMFKQRSP